MLNKPHSFPANHNCMFTIRITIMYCMYHNMTCNLPVFIVGNTVKNIV